MPPAPRVEPLSPTSFRVELTASAALRDKLEQAQNLLSHAVPSGDLAAVFERALDELIAAETKRRSGAGKPRKRRETKPGSPHVPVDIQRAVRERDGDQCTFVDAEGRRCSEKRFLTIEHIDPFARGGPTTVDNCCLLCKSHNAYRARQEFGAEHIRKKVAQARALEVEPELDNYDKAVAALVGMGFARLAARRAVAELRARGVEPSVESLLRQALALLTAWPAQQSARPKSPASEAAERRHQTGRAAMGRQLRALDTCGADALRRGPRLTRSRS